MSGTFDDKGTGESSESKRPAPTIEGTATEVSVEPSGEENDAKSEEAKSETEMAAIEAAPDKAEENSEDAIADSESDDASGDDQTQDDPQHDDDQHDAETADDDSGDDDDLTSHEDDEVEVPVAAAPSEPKSTGGFLSWLAALFTHLLAGAVGAAAVLAALILGYLPGITPIGSGEQTADIASLQDRIATLESAPKTDGNAAALESLKSRLAALESQSEQTSRPSVDLDAFKALSDRVAQMDARLKSMADAASQGGSVADAAAIAEQVGAAEKRLEDAMDRKISEQVKAAMADQPASETDTKALAALQTEVSGLSAKLKALAEASLEDGDLAKLKPEVAALEDRVDKIETTLPALSKAIDAERDQTKKANLAIAFSGLREAVNAGRPYTVELTTLSALAPGSTNLGDLIEYEDTGIPTLAMLKDTFGPLRTEVLGALASTDEDFFGRLLGSAQSLVTVTRVGEEAKGDTPDAVLARAGAQLDGGHLDAAVVELGKLQGPAAKTMDPWLSQASARLDAATTLQRLQDQLPVSHSGSEHDDANQATQ